jgi:dihydrofolate synthase/folylpolyglutamate synthase
MVEHQYVVDFYTEHQHYFEKIEPSFFEMTVAMAFDYFRRKKVEMAVVEVGLGGRLDSTNIIDPEVSVITNISLDHTQILGNTVEAIAPEKGGIIKHGRPVVVGEHDPVSASIFESLAKEKKSPLHFADREYRVEVLHRQDFSGTAFRVRKGRDEKYEHLKTDLTGSYQKMNLATCLQTIDVMNSRGFEIGEEAVRAGLKNVSGHTSLLGRWYVLRREPLVICDIAHNAAGLLCNLKELEKMDSRKLHFVLGFVDDKDMDSILPLFPASAGYYFTRADVPRAMDEKVLKSMAEEYGFSGNSYFPSSEALRESLRNAGNGDVVYVGGSTFVVSELI